MVPVEVLGFDAPLAGVVAALVGTLVALFPSLAPAGPTLGFEAAGIEAVGATVAAPPVIPVAGESVTSCGPAGSLQPATSTDHGSTTSKPE